MVRHFEVGAPADLAALEAFVSGGTLGNVTRVWSMARKRGLKTWDGRILAVFYAGSSGPRSASVIRVMPDGKEEEVAALRYNKALKWCSIYLRPAQNYMWR